MNENHGHDIAAHCHEPGHFNSSVKHVCWMCHDSLRAAKEKAEGALCRARGYLHGEMADRKKLEKIRTALSTSSPCPHEAEVARLREDRSERIAGARAIEILRKENDRIGEAGRGAIIAVEERLRQKSVEGWTPAHDAQHEDQELAVVAACYAANGTYAPHIDWPETWDRGWDKRKKHNRERQLAIAAALCMAEIDRLARRRFVDAG